MEGRGTHAPVFSPLQHPFANNILASRGHGPTEMGLPGSNLLRSQPAPQSINTATRHQHQRDLQLGTMLEFKNLAKRYGQLQALQEVTFSVSPGRSVGFLGPNGAGKTTTMRSIFGLIRPDSGTVTWAGNEISMEDRLSFGYMPEQRGLYARMKVKDQLVYLARLHGVPASEAKKGADVWLERLGLADRANDTLDKLSHGNQQRIQLAASILHKPSLLVLDEPFSGLDPIGVDNMKEILVEETKRGTAVLFSSHQLDLVEDVCDDIAIIQSGKVLRHGELAAEKAKAGVRNVKVIGPPDGHWASTAPGVLSHEFNVVSGEHRFLVADDVTAQDFLVAASAAGTVSSFSYTAPTLEDIYKETLR